MSKEPTEEIADAIRNLSENVGKLMNGSLNEKAIILLLQEFLPGCRSP